MKKTLRPYQQEALEALKLEVENCSEPCLVNASVGAGKSLIIAELLLWLESNNKRALCLTMNSDLISQNAKAYELQGGDCGIYCSTLKKKQHSYEVIFASPNSIIKAIQKDKDISFEHFDLIVVDECFIAGTLIDGVPIESLNPGQLIKSYNHKENKIEYKQIKNVQKRIVKKDFVVVNLGCEVLICTPNHPFYVKRKGYIEAQNINNGDIVYVEKNKLYELRKRVRAYYYAKVRFKKIWSSILHKSMRSQFTKKNIIHKNTDEGKQSYVFGEGAQENVRYTEKNRPQTKNSRWKWKGANCSSKKIIKRFKKRFCGRIYNKNKEKKYGWISTSLQNRYRSSCEKNCYRNRWWLSFRDKKKKTRFEKNPFVREQRVESVEIYQRADIERLYPNRKFDYVYNIEVEDNHNYFANNVLVHNCHNIDVKKHDSMYMRIFNHYKSYVVGLTGTPFRGKQSIIGEKAFFKKSVCDISTSWLVRNNYLVMPVYGPHAKDSIDFSKVRLNNGLFNKSDLNKVVDENKTLTHEIMEEVQELMVNRNGAFIFATSIKHCDECASVLPPEQTAIITGKTNPDYRREVLNLAREGKIKYLINVNCLTTGVDIPFYDTVVFVRPTESLTLYLQALGRGLRLHEGKSSCLVLDYAGNLERHGDIDDLIINEMVLEKAKNDPDYCIPCPTCDCLNTMHARRCIGLQDNFRCNYMFDWKNCPDCWYENDISAKNCKNCGYQLVDPNTGLSKLCSKDNIVINVAKAHFRILEELHHGKPIYQLSFHDEIGIIVDQKYYTGTEAAYSYTYFNLFKKLVPKASYLYKHLHNTKLVWDHIKQNGINRPSKLICKKNKYGLNVIDYLFDDV